MEITRFGQIEQMDNEIPSDIPVDELAFFICIAQGKTLEASIRKELGEVARMKNPQAPNDPYRPLAELLDKFMKSFPQDGWGREIPKEIRNALAAAGIQLPDGTNMKAYRQAESDYHYYLDMGDEWNAAQAKQRMDELAPHTSKYTLSDLKAIREEVVKRFPPPVKPVDESLIQMKMMAINSDMNRMNLCFEFASTMTRKAQDARQSIIGGMRA